MWTKKHDDFCMENKIKHSSQLLWRWLMTEGQPGERIEIDLLLEFNSWVHKHRPEGGFSNPTLKSALNQLEEVGIVVIEKSYSWKIHAIVFRALKWLKKSDPDPKPICENHTPIPQFVSEKLEQQQQEKELRHEISSWGIEYRAYLNWHTGNKKAAFTERLNNELLTMIQEQTTLFRISDYEVVDPKLGLSDWELDNECTDSISTSKHSNHVDIESKCTTNGAITIYYSGGTSRGKKKYFRYSWREKKRMKHCHIPGGNIDSISAKKRAALVQVEIDSGRSPVEIVQFIKSFKRIR